MLGTIFVAIVVFMPEGLVPGLTRLVRRLRRRWTVRGGSLQPSGQPLP